MRKSAFTLLELMIVVIIVGILASLAIPQFQGAAIRAKLTEIFPIVSTIAKAEEIYYMEHGEYAIIPIIGWTKTNVEGFKDRLGIIIPGENSRFVYECGGSPGDAYVTVARREGGDGGLCNYRFSNNAWFYWGRPGANPMDDEWQKYLNLP